MPCFLGGPSCIDALKARFLPNGTEQQCVEHAVGMVWFTPLLLCALAQAAVVPFRWRRASTTGGRWSTTTTNGLPTASAERRSPSVSISLQNFHDLNETALLNGCLLCCCIVQEVGYRICRVVLPYSLAAALLLLSSTITSLVRKGGRVQGGL